MLPNGLPDGAGMSNKGPQNKKGILMRIGNPGKILGFSRKVRLTVLTVAAVAAFVCTAVIASQKTAEKKTLSPQESSGNPNDVNQDSKGSNRSLFAEDPNFIGSSAGDTDMWGLFYKMLFLAGVVFALGAAVTYLSRRYGSRFSGFSGGKIQVLERAHIGPHKMVLLLKAGNRKFLLGSTRENLTMLAEITGSPDQMDLQDPQSSHAEEPHFAEKGENQIHTKNENATFKDIFKLPE